MRGLRPTFLTHGESQKNAHVRKIDNPYHTPGGSESGLSQKTPRIQRGAKRDHLLSSPRREGLLTANRKHHLAAAAVGMRCTVRQTAVSSRQSIGNCITFFMMRTGRSAACDGP